MECLPSPWPETADIVETMIAKEIIGGNHVPGDTLTVDAENGKLVLR